MSGDALSARRALARSGADQTAGEGETRAAEAEARLRALVDEVTNLDLEVEALSAELADFARMYERAVGAEHRELRKADRVVRELRTLEEALLLLKGRAEARPGSLPRVRAREKKKTGRTRQTAEGSSHGAEESGSAGDAAAAQPGEVSQEAEKAPDFEPHLLRVKRVYRRLARLLHPDLAPDDSERARLGELMAKVNLAYANRDLTALEVMAERLGAGEPPGDVSLDERVAHIERRSAAMERFAASIGRERDRLRRSDTFRLHEESIRRAADGGDFLSETQTELEDEVGAAWADALARLVALDRVARELTRARTGAMADIARRGPSGASRTFDPLKENEIVRAGASRLDRRRATAEARDLARHLENVAEKAPFEVALTLMAFFSEDAGGRPPQTLSSGEGWLKTWDLLRKDWPEAPDLPRILARLPRGLALGARVQGETIQAGVQLENLDLSAGVRIALERSEVAEIGRRVLGLLGPEEACPGCKGRQRTRHLLRTRGLDERHAFVCAECGEVLRSFWRYGEVEGLEALNGHALRLGLVEEVTIDLAGTSVGFQMLPKQCEILTTSLLRKLFVELYLSPYEIELPQASIAVLAHGEPLAASARVSHHKDLRMQVKPGSGVPTTEELLELLRARIEHRFRP